MTRRRSSPLKTTPGPLAEQVDQIVRSLQRFGWTMPILIDEADMILAGHGRVLAAAKLETRVVPVVVARGWTEDQKRAYVLADNQLALNAGWDENLLRVEFAGLQASGFNTSVSDFPGNSSPIFSPSSRDSRIPKRSRRRGRCRHLVRAMFGRWEIIASSAATARIPLLWRVSSAKSARI